MIMILSFIGTILVAEQYKPEENNVSQENFRKCKTKKDEYLKKRLREILGVNADLDDARKQFGFPVAAVAIMNEVRNCAAKNSWWGVDDWGIKQAIEKEISNYTLNVGSQGSSLGEIHASDVMAHIDAMTREKLKHRPDIRSNSSVISERVKQRVRSGYVDSRLTPDGQNKMYKLNSLYQVIHQEIINEKSNQERVSPYEKGYQDKIALFGPDHDIRRLSSDDIPTSELEQFVRKEIANQGGYGNVQAIINDIKGNPEIYLRPYHVYTHKDTVEGCYDKNTLKAVIKDAIRK